jgi:HSP20 family protein
MSDLTKYPSMTPIRNLRREMDRLFDDLVPFRLFDEERNIATGVWNPRTDIIETDNEFIINVDLPGVKKPDVTVNYQDNQLSISGERKSEEVKEKKDYLRKERIYGNFHRVYTLPQSINPNKITANFKDGILTVTVPKTEESKPKQVKIL